MWGDFLKATREFGFWGVGERGVRTRFDLFYDWGRCVFLRIAVDGTYRFSYHSQAVWVQPSTLASGNRPVQLASSASRPWSSIHPSIQPPIQPPNHPTTQPPLSLSSSPRHNPKPPTPPHPTQQPHPPSPIPHPSSPIPHLITIQPSKKNPTPMTCMPGKFLKNRGIEWMRWDGRVEGRG